MPEDAAPKRAEQRPDHRSVCHSEPAKLDPDRSKPNPNPRVQKAAECVSAILKTLSLGELRLLIDFLGVWLVMPKETRACLVKVVIPGMSDKDIARLAGCSRRSLTGWKSFQNTKATTDDFVQKRRSPSGRRVLKKPKMSRFDNPAG